MATSADARAVKSLNNSEGRKRFVFKSFSERINDIDININGYRTLNKVKAEPSEGSTFFRDCLVEWRELNTAEDFISFYEEMLPLVQNLGLVLVQKEKILSKLVSRLQMKARLSLEPILRLIAALSRDLLKDFIPFLPRIVNSLVTLLKNGAHKDPEIIEQVFTSWSSIIVSLQKYLVCDIESILRDTSELSYYPKDYISEFMSESMSFLLRNAQDEQLEKGFKMILSEVAHPSKKAGGVGLLYYVMRGTCGRLHSKAERVLSFLLKDSTLSFFDNFPQGPGTVVEVVSLALQRICEDLEAEKLVVMWEYLYKKINKSISNKKSVHLSRLLSLLTAVVKIEKGRKVHDSPSLIGIVSRTVSTFVASSETVVEGDNLSAVLDEVLQLILCTINRVNEIETVALLWAPIFALKSPSLLPFLREFLQKDQSVVKAFTNNILCAINNMIWESSEEVIPLLLTLCERQQTSHDMVNIISQTFESRYERIHEFLEENIKKVQQNIEDTGLARIDEAELAAIWGVVNCYPYFKVDSSLLFCFKKSLRQHLAVSDDTCSGPELMWQSLLGTALRSCYKMLGRINHSDLEEALSFAKDYKSCVQVLSPVADVLEFMHRPALAHDDRSKAYPELQAKKAGDAFEIFSENLRHPNKDIRLMTLRILCHFETLSSEEIKKSLPKGNVLQLLLSVEETAHTVDTSRMLVNLISTIQKDLSAGRIHAAYVKLVLNGMLGLLHNEFLYLWGPASECLAVLVRNYTGAVWSDFVCYLEQCQLKFETLHDHSENANQSMSERHTDLIGRFNSVLFPLSKSTPTATVVSQLLQILQKASSVAQSRASEILPLLLKFLGYNSENPVSVGSYNGRVCKGEDWKRVLIQWLILLKLMKNPMSFRFSQFLNDVLQNRFLDDNDAEIQTNVLECLLLTNDFLLPHRQRLLNLIKPKELREELTTWNLSEDIGEPHRSYIFSLVIRILMPKVRTLKNLASRKHTSIRHRKAVLCFISQLDVNELALFFALLIKPLNIISEETMDSFWSSGKSSLEYFQNSNFLKYFTVDTISTLSRNQKSGFLHVIQHILEVFDELRVRPFLDFLMGCVVRLLVNYAPNVDEERNIDSLALSNATDAQSASDDKENASINHDQAGTALKQFKELRSLCLKIIAHVLDKYEDCDLGSKFWDLFFSAVSPLIKSFKQEGSSSEKPSSLFSCFLSMSKSRNLMKLLCREESLVPDIFSILTVTTASEAIKSSALKFIENLLCLDNELGEDDNMICGFLDPYIEALINSLHSLFIGDILKRKSVKYHGEREIKILKLLSKRMRDRSHVMKYLDVLLSFLNKSVKDSDIRRDALLAIQDIISYLGMESTSKIINTVSPLLVDAELDVRLCICDLLESLANIDFSLDDVAKRVRDMNAISAMEVDDLDYEKIVNAYLEINAEFFFKSSEQHTMIILSQCIYNVSSESIMLRGSAQKLLSSFIDFSASILCLEAPAHPEFGEEEVQKADVNWTGDRVLCILRNFILKHIGDAINRGGIIIKEWILLIREMVTKLPDAGNLSAFRSLCSEDENVDFFKAIVHIQAHRRARAISRFANVVKDSSLPEGVVRKLLVSVFFNMLLDGQDGKDNNVKNACTEALASISAHMSWTSYYALLNRCFREMNKHAKKGKILLRLICLILDKFHFAKDGYPQEAEEIRTCLQKIVFPRMQKLMNSDSDNVNVNSSVAALKVLKLLPEDVMDSHLSSIVHKIASFLKNRLESTRDEARLALVACLKELGLEYLQVVVNILRAILKRGSEVHVLGYTLNSILSKCLSNPTCGKLDHCLGDLLAVVETDILGEVAEQKEVEKFASKMKETRKRKSFETLKLIAENVTFRSHGLKLLSPVTAQLQRHLTPKIKTNLEEMLKQIAAGIEGNTSVDQGDLFLFIYGLVDDGINNRSGLGDQVSAPPSKTSRKSRDLKETTGLFFGPKSCPHLITVFALDLLYNRMKKLKLDNTDEELLSKLDPFVKLLAGCLSSKYEDIVSSSLRCFTSLVKFPLPSLTSEADELKTALLTIAQSAVSSSSPLVQSCLKLLTTLLDNKNITLSSEQLKMLIQFPIFIDLESDSSFVALSLLKAIVKRKLVVPEIYDIANQVSKLMVNSQLESIRKKCKQILLQFMVHYTLSEKRLEQHVNFLLENLRYEFPTGREAVLDMLHALILKFSEPNLGKQSVLDQQSQKLFIQLTVCLSNETDNEVLPRVGAVIEVLIGRMSKDQVDSSLLYCLCWYKQQNLRAAAAQVLGFFIGAMKKTFRKHIYNTVQDAKTILESAICASSLQLQDTVEEASLPFWKEAYYSLVMIEKMLEQFPDLRFGKDLEDIWKMVFKFLLHPHAWLRNKSCRLLNHYFGALAGRKRPECHTFVVDSLLERPSSLFMVAVSLCFQLKEQPTMGNVDVDLLTANIVFAVSSLHSLIGQSDQETYNGFWSSLGEDEQVVFLKAFEVLDSGKGRSTFLALTSGKRTENGEDDGNDIRNVLIGSLLKRMGKIALDMEAVQMRVVFNVYKAFASQLNQEECYLYAYKILLPLYKVCEGFTGKIITDELKQLAEEVRDSIRDKSLGNKMFVEVYSEIRNSLRRKREKKKREEKLMAVVNPERNAKRKLRLASKNKANKKRRMTSMKLSRWACS
ncbi:U3 small nucleolar RNA-associated protein 20 isoform X2 [Arabidopsis lyrata subsp. lyrata]|uniref:U3 small nucleolar RNA-associated protein 20 isoform X2 n=1 Tax=Arabidopsis lyrata subsp. lyrata TaxID=81972 RepID=UPI000A29A528|nr:U3 small nucleolar RNA-associated protein 20 isoform X2 [Arabidopsis lyrata subsp. lyrata]|eukprot:XP_020872517.1 U3 small nucleolar RNA-associated protein 20 isoform X2 [Arabidopsis lyrata subsp. lyrata]